MAKIMYGPKIFEKYVEDSFPKIWEIGKNISWDEFLKKRNSSLIQKDEILKIGKNYAIINKIESDKRKIYIYRNACNGEYCFAEKLVKCIIESSDLEKGKINSVRLLKSKDGGKAIERGKYGKILDYCYDHHLEATA